MFWRALAFRGGTKQSLLVTDKSDDAWIESLTSGSPKSRDLALSDLGVHLMGKLAQDFASSLNHEALEQVTQESLAVIVETIEHLPAEKEFVPWALNIAAKEAQRVALEKRTKVSRSGA